MVADVEVNFRAFEGVFTFETGVLGLFYTG
jgi:hypothetical protein